MMGFDEGAGPIVHDVGKPEFLDVMRRATGRTLEVPTMAERLKDHGGAIIMSNVSPGAAYFHDPDGHGHVYHRAGSFGPGRVELPPEDARPVTPDAAGDAALTERFCSEILLERKPPLGVLWLCDPDKSMHADLLGSQTHLDGIKAADTCVARVPKRWRNSARRVRMCFSSWGRTMARRALQTLFLLRPSWSRPS